MRMQTQSWPQTLIGASSESKGVRLPLNGINVLYLNNLLITKPRILVVKDPGHHGVKGTGTISS